MRFNIYSNEYNWRIFVRKDIGYQTVADRLYPGRNLKSYNRADSESPRVTRYIDKHSLRVEFGARGIQTTSCHERFLRRPNISHLALCRDNEALGEKSFV
jgi:hypothetical protein